MIEFRVRFLGRGRKWIRMALVIIDPKTSFEEIARLLREGARSAGPYDGTATPWNLNLLDRQRVIHLPTGSSIIFTRDSGHHSSGWWKNPEYERCEHLSLCFMDMQSGAPRPKHRKLTRRWIEAFFGDNKRFVWAEPPATARGKAQETWHYRVFCDPSWNPIVPKGEVYSKDLTAAGWLSWSDLQEKRKRLAGETKL